MGYSNGDLEAFNIWEALEEEYHDVPALPEDQRVKGQGNSISHTIFTKIMSLKTVKEIWDFLESEYEGNERPTAT